MYGSVQSEWSLAHRYVDNRLLITPRHTFQTLSVQLFWNLSFYTPPIMLETVEGDEALGFSISLPQRSITMILPWKTIFWRKHMIAWGIIMYSDGQLLRTSFGKKI